MTSAERMREIAKQVRERAKEKKARDYDIYTKKLVLGKITKSARKGLNACQIKIKSSIPPNEIIDRLQNEPRCFGVTLIYAKGRNYIKVYW